MKSLLLKQIWLMTKCAFYGVFIQCLLCGILIASDGNSQNVKLKDVKLSMTVDDVHLTDAFSEVSEKTGFNFIYNNSVVKNSKITLDLKEQSLMKLLMDFSNHFDIKFKRINENIYVSKIKKRNSVTERIVEEASVDITITGTITDEKGEAIPGVNILVKGTTMGTITDVNGNYTVTVPNEESVLVFSFIGMETQEELVGARSVINVTMGASAQTLEEIVVIPFGTANKNTFTGAATNVVGQNVTNTAGGLEQAIQGNVSGVQVIGNEVKIRGYGSFSGDTKPLYVVDGIAGAPRPNPENIASVSVLKDASATVLYGSEASNGVIIITTKKSGEMNTEIDAKYRRSVIANITPDYTMMNAEQYYRTMLEGIKASKMQTNPKLTEEKAYNDSFKQMVGDIGPYNPYNMNNPYEYIDGQLKLKSDAKLLYSTDWLDEVYTAPYRDEYFLTVRGGNDKVRFNWALMYDQNTQLSEKSKSQTYQSDLSISSNLSEKFTIGGRVLTQLSKTKTRGGGISLIKMKSVLPIVNPYELKKNINKTNGTWTYEQKLDEAGNPVFEKGLEFPLMPGNPLNNLANNYGESTASSLFVSPFLEFKPIQGLKFRLNSSIQTSKSRRDGFSKTTDVFVSPPKDKITLFKSPKESLIYQYNLIGTYNKSFDRHNFEITLGMEGYKNEDRGITVEATDFPFGASIQELQGGNVKKAMRSTTKIYSRAAPIITNLSYDYDGKYFLSGSFRRDGSSKFGFDTRYGNFYAVGAGWRLDREAFLENSDLINMLKLRVSYGMTGNSFAIGHYDHLDSYSPGYKYNGTLGLYHTRSANRKLAWEVKKQLSVGIDFELLDRKVTGSLGYYDNNSDGMLSTKILPVTSGFSQYKANIGKVNDSGIELMLKTTNIQNNNFSWGSQLTFTYNNNKAVELPDDKSISTTFNNRIKEGENIYTYYMREWAGVNPENGKGQWWEYETVKDDKGNIVRDKFGDPTFTGKRKKTENYNMATKRNVGISAPPYTGAFTNNFAYKGIELSFVLLYSWGNKVYDEQYAGVMHDGAVNRRNLASDAWKRSWKKPGDVTDVPRYVYDNGSQSNKTSTRFLVDGSYLKISNVVLGYALPQSICEKIRLKNVKLYATADNLLILTKMKTGDPGRSFFGNENLAFDPLTRTFRFSIEIKI